MVATGVSIEGTREVPCTAVGDSESFEFWREFLFELKARGLSGVHLVISDAHAGLKAAVVQQFSGAAWQRCRVHFMRNVGSAVSSKQVPPVMAAIKTIFAHTEPRAVAEQWDNVADTLAGPIQGTILPYNLKAHRVAATIFCHGHSTRKLFISAQLDAATTR